MNKNIKLKKDKKIIHKKTKKLNQLINDSDSSSESEHELSYYVNDRIKLMREVIRILKPKKIKSMAPQSLRHLNIEEINSMLLEELLGISNKRLKGIFIGKPQEDDTSSTDEEEEKSPDVISLDDVTDDDFIIDLDSDDGKSTTRKKNKVKVKEESKDSKGIKKEIKSDKNKKNKGDDKNSETNDKQLMSVLELLELQARARAIRSQIALENSRKTQEQETEQRVDISDAEDAIIIESPRNEQIIIASSDSECETNKNESEIHTISNSNETAVGGDVEIIVDSPNQSSKSNQSTGLLENPEEINKLLNKLHKIKKLKRKSNNHETGKIEKRSRNECGKTNQIKKDCQDFQNDTVSKSTSETDCDKRISTEDEEHNDGIVLNVDQYELDSINLDSTKKLEIVISDTNQVIDKYVDKHKQGKIIIESVVVEQPTNSSCEGKPDNFTINNEVELKKTQQISNNIVDKRTSIDEGDGIILNVDQSELDSVNSDSRT